MNRYKISKGTSGAVVSELRKKGYTAHTKEEQGDTILYTNYTYAPQKSTQKTDADSAEKRYQEAKRQEAQERLEQARRESERERFERLEREQQERNERRKKKRESDERWEMIGTKLVVGIGCPVLIALIVLVAIGVSSITPGDPTAAFLIAVLVIVTIKAIFNID